MDQGQLAQQIAIAGVAQQLGQRLHARVAIAHARAVGAAFE